MSTHYEASMEQDMARIRSKIAAMAALCDRALKDCIRAIRERNRQLAYAVILRDKGIDALEEEIDRLCLEFIVRQQPVAGCLRFAYSTIRINLELERVGDYAESIARQSIKIFPLQFQIPENRLVELAETSIPMLQDAIRAFSNQDAELARRTMETEEVVDVLKSRLNKDLVGLFRNSEIPFEALNPLMMITRRFERVSDQARNICKETIYMCTGEFSRHQGNEIHRVLFVDDENASLSQMAECIASQTPTDKFLFSSAGLKAGQLDPSTLDFLETKGLATQRLAPKTIEQITNLDHYHVIVCLSDEALKIFSKSSRRVVLLDWRQNQPSEQVLIQTQFDYLQSHIHDLVEAVIGHDDE